MQSYTDLFSSRGSAYDTAMRRHPDARAAEFAQIVAAAAIEPGMLVGDVPAGGGYLAHYLPEGCICLEHEPCADFGGDAQVRLHGSQQVSLLPLPWQDGVLDVIMSLAGVHHLDDKRPLFAEMRRVTRPGGRLVLSDVAEGSATARFLDGFVGATNSTGHEGVFLNENTQQELAAAGWQVLDATTNDFHWRFDSREAMADFCRWLFDIRKASLEEIIEAIEQGPGMDLEPDGTVGMRWSLATFTAENPA